MRPILLSLVALAASVAQVTSVPAAGGSSTPATVDASSVANATYVSVSGTNTLTGNTSTAYPGYATGRPIQFIPANTNTGAVTINVQSLGAKSVTLDGSTPLVGGELNAGKPYIAFYDGTGFQVNAGLTNICTGCAGTLGLPYGTQSLASLGANSSGFIGPTTGTGQHYLGLPNADATANQFLLFGATSGGIAPGTLTTFSSTNLTDTANLVRNNATNTFSTGTQDLSGSAHTLPTKKGTAASVPATCTVGELYFATDATAGQNIYECAATNTWTQQLNSGNGAATAGGSSTQIQYNAGGSLGGIADFTFDGSHTQSIGAAGILDATATGAQIKYGPQAPQFANSANSGTNLDAICAASAGSPACPTGTGSQNVVGTADTAFSHIVTMPINVPGANRAIRWTVGMDVVAANSVAQQYKLKACSVANYSGGTCSANGVTLWTSSSGSLNSTGIITQAGYSWVIQGAGSGILNTNCVSTIGAARGTSITVNTQSQVSSVPMTTGSWVIYLTVNYASATAGYWSAVTQSIVENIW